MAASGRRFRSLETNLVHAGTAPELQQGAVVHPIFQSANYLMQAARTYGELRYIRLNNSPSHRVLHERLAAIEGTEAALVTSSGMAAITSTLLAFASAGDHILAHRSLYGGTRNFLEQDAPRFGITHDTMDMTDPATWERSLRPETRVLYVEGISNPLMEVGELEQLVAFARAHGLRTLIDNTFPSPVNFRPAELGFDLVLHSATKYLNGHSDIVAGVVAGSAEDVGRVVQLVNHLGGSLDPHACFLLERGLKTLAVRVERQNATAQRLAQFLSSRPEVVRVNYPGLETDPGHARARRWFQGFGGMLSFYVHTPEQAGVLLANLRIPLHAPSLGGTETLVVQPARSSHLGLSAEERELTGIRDTLIRVSVGLENAEELIEDFEQALAKCC